MELWGPYGYKVRGQPGTGKSGINYFVNILSFFCHLVLSFFCHSLLCLICLLSFFCHLFVIFLSFSFVSDLFVVIFLSLSVLIWFYFASVFFWSFFVILQNSQFLMKIMQNTRKMTKKWQTNDKKITKKIQRPKSSKTWKNLVFCHFFCHFH